MGVVESSDRNPSLQVVRAYNKLSESSLKTARESIERVSDHRVSDQRGGREPVPAQLIETAYESTLIFLNASAVVMAYLDLHERNLQDQLVDLSNKVSQLSSRIISKKKEISKQDTNLSGERARLKSVQSNLAQLNSDIENYERQKKSSAVDIGISLSPFGSVFKAISEKNAAHLIPGYTFANGISSIIEANREADACRSKVSGLESSIRSLESNISSMTREKSSLENEKLGLERTRQYLDESKRDISIKRTTLLNALTTVKEKCNTITHSGHTNMSDLIELIEDEIITDEELHSFASLLSTTTQTISRLL